jgi:hypothetical protein
VRDCVTVSACFPIAAVEANFEIDLAVDLDPCRFEGGNAISRLMHGRSNYGQLRRCIVGATVNALDVNAPLSWYHGGSAHPESDCYRLYQMLFLRGTQHLPSQVAMPRQSINLTLGTYLGIAFNNHLLMSPSVP